MSDSWQVRAQFDSLAGLRRGVEEVKAAGLADYEIYSPVLHDEELEARMPRRGSVVRWSSVAGGIAGVALGLWMCFGSSALYRLVTGGKPWGSLVPFVVIAFECTILFAALATVAALVYYARLTPLAPPAEYDARFSGDRYGLFVRCEPERKESAVRLLQAAGATEVIQRDGA